MTRPFPCAIFLAYSNWAGLTGLGSSFPGVSPTAFLGACSLRNLRQIRDRRFVAGRRLDALLADEAVGKALHGRRWRIRCGAVIDCSTKQGGASGGGACPQLADDAVGDIAHGVNRTDHLLLADNHIIEQAFKLR